MSSRRSRNHAFLVEEQKITKNYIRNNYEITGFKPANRIVVSKYYPSPLEGTPTAWHYKGTIARGKEYRQLHKVDPKFYTYVGKVNK